MTPTEQVQQVQTAFIAALNQGDVAALMRLNHPDGNSFYVDNNLLSPDPDQQGWEQAFAAGLKYALQSRHEAINVFGDCAIITGYIVGTVTAPGGGSQTGTWRATTVWVKVEATWRNYHVHLSPLAPVQSSS